MWRLLWIPWRWWRRAAQLALLVLFLWLFRRTEYRRAEQLAGGENIFFRLDPLAGAAAMIAARQFISLFWPALAVVGLTMVFGRFFCGWVCPLGTLLDYFHRIVDRSGLAFGSGSGSRPKAKAFGRLASPPQVSGHAILSSDRRSIGRRVRLSVGRLRRSVFALGARNDALGRSVALSRSGCLLRLDGGWLGHERFAAVGEETPAPVPPDGVSPGRRVRGDFGDDFRLELVARRFWCRYVCPAGALFGLLASRSLVKRVPAKACKACGQCRQPAAWTPSI